MPLNLLQISDRVLNDASSFSKPNYLIGNVSDDTATTLLSAAFKVGEELARDYDWQELMATATVTTVIGQSLYQLPSDMERISSDTMWNTTDKERMFGPKTRRQWAEVTNSQTLSAIDYRWRLHGNRIQIHPTPDEVFSFEYSYLSRAYCTDSNGVDRPDGWVADTDIPKLPADLFIAGILYNFGKSKNLPGSIAAGADFDAIIKSRQNKNVPAASIDYSASVVAPRDRGRRVLNIPDVVPY